MISSAEAHNIIQPLLDTSLKEGDKWYAVSKKWYNNVNDWLADKGQYPAKMNNSDLKSVNNTFELSKELNENEHFVWIYQDLYNYFSDWFGIQDGSLTFQRQVIDIGNEMKQELIIEMHPIYVC